MNKRLPSDYFRASGCGLHCSDQGNLNIYKPNVNNVQASLKLTYFRISNLSNSKVFFFITVQWSSRCFYFPVFKFNLLTYGSHLHLFTGWDSVTLSVCWELFTKMSEWPSRSVWWGCPSHIINDTSRRSQVQRHLPSTTTHTLPRLSTSKLEDRIPHGL